ncbi:MAG TPA: alpha/beta hydrolase [Pseudobdellovibrionaceae bacterium]|jgi:alpha-beta hydrolase superfamily lysophospholipase
MIKKIFSLLLVISLNACFAQASSDLQIHFLSIPYGSEVLNLRIGIQNPDQVAVGDILYIHGFGDRLDNHQPLFRAWTKAGFRVIAFDLPSHGENSGTYNDLNNFSFEELAALAVKVEGETKPDTARPLILSGWSTGGLVVVRMIQEKWMADLSRPVSGVILFAPGISVRKFPWTFGNRLGMVTEKTLTHDPHPPHVAPVRPDTPFWSHLAFQFSPRLVAESILSQHRSYPTDIPTLIFTGGDAEDMYAKEWVVRSWIQEQNRVRQSSQSSPIVNVACSGARHELDNETESFGGLEVQNSSAAFAQAIAAGKLEMFSAGKDTFGKICK